MAFIFGVLFKGRLLLIGGGFDKCTDRLFFVSAGYLRMRLAGENHQSSQVLQIEYGIYRTGILLR